MGPSCRPLSIREPTSARGQESVAPEDFGDYASALVHAIFAGIPLSVAYSQALVQLDPARPGLVDTVLRLTRRQALWVSLLAIGWAAALAAFESQRVAICFLALVTGQIIGAIGSTGKSTGPHLHYEIWRHGKPVNPMRFLNPKPGEEP